MATGKSRGILHRKSAAILLLMSVSLAAGFQTQPAQAFWWPFKKKASQSQDQDQKRKARATAGTPIGLVPGNPPALCWKPSGTPRAALLCLHELGLHKGVFDDLGSRMAKQGVIVYAIDLRGFGDWQEADDQSAQMDLRTTFSDVKQSLEIIHKLHPDSPVFILGEAMGGALALELAARYPELTNGVISAAPGGEHFKTVSNYMNVSTKVLSGRMSRDSGMSEQLIELATPKPNLREVLMSDAQVRLDLSPRELMACQFYMYKTKKFARQIRETPVMIVHGAKDGESRSIGSEKVYKRLATKKKKYLEVPDGDHYVFEDTRVHDQAFNEALSWIDTNLTPVSTGSGGGR